MSEVTRILEAIENSRARLVKLCDCGRALLTEKPLETAALTGDYITDKPLPFGEAKQLRLKSIVLRQRQRKSRSNQ